LRGDVTLLLISSTVGAQAKEGLSSIRTRFGVSWSTKGGKMNFDTLSSNVLFDKPPGQKARVILDEHARERLENLKQTDFSMSQEQKLRYSIKRELFTGCVIYCAK